MDPDASNLFVLKSKGSWLHCGYHLTTAIVSPALLTLPFCFALLGWTGGVLCLTAVGLVSFYCYYLLSSVLEHYEQLGKRHLRFPDMARDILPPGRVGYVVKNVQLAICYCAVIAYTVLGGYSLKFIYLVTTPNGKIKLHQFVMIFGCLNLVMAQMPSFHSLRHINLVSVILCIAYCACTTAASIDIGHSNNAPTKDYTFTGVGINRVYDIFNAIAIIIVTYANGIVPEIQATIAPPTTGKLFKGLQFCYFVVICTFLSVAISGYWAFGNQARPSVLSNLMADGRPLLPEWFLFTTGVLTLVQLSAVVLVYLQPTNVIIELEADDPPQNGEFSIGNVVTRLIFRSLSVIVATLIAAILPKFFAGPMALAWTAVLEIIATGCICLDFILPIVFYHRTFKPSKRSFVFWGNSAIIVVFILLLVVRIAAPILHACT